MAIPFTRKLLALFFSKIELEESGCWLWRAAKNTDCYGVFFGISAHRASHLWFVGPIPDGWQVDHLCRHRWCVNPAHLEAVTRSENVLRANAAVGFCKHGHPWTPENVRLWKTNGGRRTAQCAACSRVRSRAYSARQKEKEAC